MGEDSAIEWTDATFNPWWGCTKVSPACDHCYAETWSKRAGFPDLWGTDNYRLFGEKHWRQPLLWNERAMLSHRRLKVFCASMADVFDKDAPASERAKLWRLIEATPWLEWLLLTKRIGNAARMLPEHLLINVWLGASVVTRDEFDRDVPKLRWLPAQVRFLSIEPLIEDLGTRLDLAGIDWVIVGGESGKQARPMETDWARWILSECRRQNVRYFFKQGSQANWPRFKDPAEFPADLRVREWPERWEAKQ